MNEPTPNGTDTLTAPPLSALLGRLTGYEPEMVRRLSASNGWVLGLHGAMGLLASALFGLSAGYLVYLSFSSLGAAIVWGIAVGVFMLNLGRLLCAGSGYAVADPEDKIAEWKPSPLGFIIMGFFALIFSQPLALLVRSTQVESDLALRKQTLIAVHTQRVNHDLVERETTLVRDRATIDEELAQLAARRKQITAGGKEGVPSEPQPDARDAEASPAAPTQPPTLAARPPGVGRAAHRHALLFGMQSYRSAPLQSPDRDARDLKPKLEAIGFEVRVFTDLGKQATMAAIDSYVQSLQTGDISLFFYSGHGAQISGENYLIPVDYDGTVNKAVALTPAVEAIDQRVPQLSVVILDACRSGENTPGQGGLAKLEAGRGTIITMATAPGNYALDGPPGGHSLFTEALLAWIDKPLDVEIMFSKVRKDVDRMSGGKQLPWTTSSVLGDFVLAAPDSATPLASARDAPSSVPARAGVAPQGGQARRTPIASMVLEQVNERTSQDLGRRAIVQRHLDEIAAERQRVLGPELQAYVARVSEAGFLVERLDVAWNHWFITGVLTILLSAILAATPALRHLSPESLRAYEREHWEEARRATDHGQRLCRADERMVLGCEPGYRDGLSQSPFLDPPYDTMPDRGSDGVPDRGDGADTRLLAALGS